MKPVILLIIASSLLSASFLTTSVAAEGVYKWIDEKGVTHFTSKPPHPGAKPADLPEIMKGDYKVGTAMLKTCDKRGGIDCSKGADDDGSVICSDGFRDASTRFAFHCSSPRLALSDISDVDGSGEFRVFVRNSNSVKARGTKIEFAAPSGEKIYLSGPLEVEPFGVAEYLFQASSGYVVHQKPSEAQIVITCENCG